MPPKLIPKYIQQVIAFRAVPPKPVTERVAEPVTPPAPPSSPTVPEIVVEEKKPEPLVEVKAETTPPPPQKKRKRGTLFVPQEPLSLPSPIYVRKAVTEGSNEERVYGTLLYVDDPTGHARNITYKGEKMNSAYIFELPSKDDPEKKVYFVRPTTVESYVRGTETGKGWNAIYVDGPQGPCALADYCNRGSKPGFKNDPAITLQMRDQWCLLARQHYCRPARVTVIAELEEQLAGGGQSKKRKQPPPVPVTRWDPPAPERKMEPIQERRQPEKGTPPTPGLQCMCGLDVAAAFSRFVQRYQDSRCFQGCIDQESLDYQIASETAEFMDLILMPSLTEENVVRQNDPLLTDDGFGGQMETVENDVLQIE